MSSVFILCAGDGARWNDHLGIPKQLITFGNERLIDRTARLVSSHGNSDLCCVTQDSRISITPYKSLFVSPTESVTETILKTSTQWSDRNIFLLGDVFYSEHALALILQCKRSLAFFGRPWPSAFVNCGHGEMFGLSFTAGAAEVVQDLLASALSRRAETEARLWSLYQLAGGLPLRSSQYLPELLVPIDDYTNDIDTPVDYRRRGRLYERISSRGEQAMALRLRTMAILPAHTLGLFHWRLSSLRANLPSQLRKAAIEPKPRTFAKEVLLGQTTIIAPNAVDAIK